MRKTSNLTNVISKALLISMVIVFTLAVSNQNSLPQLTNDMGLSPEGLVAAAEPGGICLYMPPPRPGFQIASSPVPNDIPGGDIPAVRYVMDPYPSFNGIAVDSENNRVVISDANRHSLLIYDRARGSRSSEVTEPLRQIRGPETKVGFMAGVDVDPAKRELYAVNNDAGDSVVVFSYDDAGNVKPKRILMVPHQAYDIALSRSRREMAISNQSLNMILFYRQEATGLEAPLRVIRGPNTSLADPHGVDLDEINNEIAVANQGSWREAPPNPYVFEGSGSQPKFSTGGRFEPPSIRIYPATAEGDVRPVRSIQGPLTKLNWPMDISVDPLHNEIAVANNGDNSILIFRRTDTGNVAPTRIIRGNRTNLDRPMGVDIDTKNDELWVTNFGSHSAVVFARTADGNVAPKRIIRSAPAGTPAPGFGNPQSIAYDPRRDEILVPN